MSTLAQILVATIISIVSSFTNFDLETDIGKTETGIEKFDHQEENKFLSGIPMKC